MPRYPIYIPSKGRAERLLTARFLMADKIPFHVVVEAQERDAYARVVGADRVLVLPHVGQGLFQSRNWIKAHATAAGTVRHWQLDDNIKRIRRLWGLKRIPCAAGPALAAVEDFVDRYENVAVAGLAYEEFVVPRAKLPPFSVNTHVYSTTLVLNAVPFGWRMLYNDDTDLCLQALAQGWCTVQVNAFMANKMKTMTVAGGNVDIYQGDGRLRMARDLERLWPGLVTVRRRYGRPQHVIDWKRFQKRSLILRAGMVDKPADEYGMTLRALDPARVAASPELTEIMDQYAAHTKGDA